jgi:hypothetical protein
MVLPEMPKQLRRLQMEIAARIDVVEVSIHPNEDGNEDAWMLYMEFTDGQEHMLYVSAEKCAHRKHIEQIVMSLTKDVA